MTVQTVTSDTAPWSPPSAAWSSVPAKFARSAARALRVDLVTRVLLIALWSPVAWWAAHFPETWTGAHEIVRFCGYVGAVIVTTHVVAAALEVRRMLRGWSDSNSVTRTMTSIQIWAWLTLAGHTVVLGLLAKLVAESARPTALFNVAVVVAPAMIMAGCVTTILAARNAAKQR